jgi:uncharacterized protein
MEIYYIVGMLVGLLLGSTGAGGGSLTTPLLVTFAHLSVTQASAISLFSVGITACVATYIGLLGRLVRYKAAILMAISGICISPLGYYFSRILPHIILIYILIALLLFLSARHWVSKKIINNKNNRHMSEVKYCIISEKNGKFIWTFSCFWRLVLLGMSAGFASGLLGLGGGFIIVPFLKQISNLSSRSIVYTSLAVVALISISGIFSAIFINSGNIPWQAIAPFCVFCIAGLMCGNYIKKHINENVIQAIFSLITLVLCVLLTFNLF